MWQHWKQKYSAVLIGSVFFACMGALGYLTIVAKNLGARPVYRMPVRLVTSEGLQIGAKVYIQGVEAGSVGGLFFMELDENGWPRPFQAKGPSHGQTVIAVLNLTRDASYYENYTLLMKHATVLSAKIVEIVPGNGVINTDPNNPDFDYKTRFERIHPLTLSDEEYFQFQKNGILPRKAGTRLLAARNYDDPLYQIAIVLKENRRDIHAITSNLREVSMKLDRGHGSIARVVNDPRLMNELNTLLETVILLTTDARRGTEDLRESQTLIDFLNLMLTFTAIL